MTDLSTIFDGIDNGTSLSAGEVQRAALSTIFDGIDNGTSWSAGVVFKRAAALPLDKYSLFPSKAKADTYASSDPVAYPGQVIGVATDTNVTMYYIDNNYKLVEIGSASGASGDLSALSVALSTDLSAEIINRTKAIEDLSTALSTDLSAEAKTREDNDKALSDDYVKKIGDLSTALSTDLSAEAKTREDNDKTLSDDYVKKIGDLSTALSTDVKALSVALSTEISALKENSNEELKAVSVALSTDYVKKIGDLSTALSTDIDAEVAARKANDTFISGQVDALSDGISADVKALSTALSTEISAETAARNAAVKALSTALSTDLSVENARALSAEAKVLDDAKSYANGISTSLSTDYTEKIAALNDKLSSAWQFKGAKDLSAYSTLAEAQAAADPDPKNGDVIIINTPFTDEDGSTRTVAIEYAYDGTTWQQLGDESSNVSKHMLKEAIQGLSATVSAEIDHDVEALSTALSTDIDTEIAARKANDTYLSGKIDDLSDGISADVKALSTALSTEISAETIARDNAVKALSTALSTDLSAEKIVRETNDKALSDDYVKKIGDLSTALSTDVKALSTALSTEISSLNSNAEKKIEALSTALSTDIKALSVALSTEISAETKAREANDTFISGQVDALSSGISADVKALSVALSTEISAEAVARAAADDSEAATRAAADTVLSTAIDSKIKAQIGDDADAVSVDTLTIHKISQDKYAELLTSNAIVSTDIYIVSADYLNAYDEQVKNVADATDAQDAVTYKQLIDLSTSLSDTIALSVGKLEDEITEAVKGGVEELSSKLLSANGIIPTLETKVNTLCANLSTEISAENARAVEKENKLCTEIQNLSTALSTDLSVLSTDVYTSLSVNVTAADGEGDVLKKYTITQGSKSYTIDIPKDYLVKSATVKTSAKDDDPVAGMKSGEKYIDFTINTKDGSGTGTAQHIYIPFKDLAQLYTAVDSNTIDMTITDDNKISAVVKDSSITNAKLANESVTQNKLSGEFYFNCGNASGFIA